MKMPNFCTPSTRRRQDVTERRATWLERAQRGYFSHWAFPCNSAGREMLTWIGKALNENAYSSCPFRPVPQPPASPQQIFPAPNHPLTPQHHLPSLDADWCRRPGLGPEGDFNITSKHASGGPFISPEMSLAEAKLPLSISNCRLSPLPYSVPSSSSSRKHFLTRANG